MTSAHRSDDLLPRPGDMIAGKYRVETVIGRGGMGVVLGAVDLSLGRNVAIKFLSPQKLEREGARARFLREARAAANMQSENVVRIYDTGTTDAGAPFIVMEHLRGADLAHVLASRGSLPIAEAVDYVLQACEALGEAHARGIVHRDLKPQNLFLTQRADGSPCVKVLDFGISKATDGESQNLTSTDMVMGTPLYMSPEQVRSLKSVDLRADVWALGVIVFELLTTTTVFEAPSVSALCAAIVSDRPVPLRARRPDAPPELEAVILRCLEKDPANRFQAVAELAEALAPFATARGRDSAMRARSMARATGSDRVVVAPGGPSGSATTTGSGPTVAAAMPGALPPAVPTTQEAWQNASFARTPPMAASKRSGSGAILALVFGGIAFVVVAVIAIGAFVYVRATSRDEALAASPGASAAGPSAASPPDVAASPAAPASPSSTAATSQATSRATAQADGKRAPSPAPPPASSPAPKPDAKDAGAAEAPKDAGGANADEELRARAARAQQLCDHHTRWMDRARTDAERKQAAQTAKNLTCRGAVSSSCERQVCLQACRALNDATCLRQVQYVIEHGPKPAF